MAACAKRLSRAIPEDLSIVAITPVGSRPKKARLSAVEVDLAEIGKLAVHVVLSRLDEMERPPCTLLTKATVRPGPSASTPSPVA